MSWVLGQQLQGGKYLIEEELGAGGFGSTYRAKDNHGREVAIKTLNYSVQRRPDFAKIQQDFLNEAIKLAKCSHPHIVRIEEVIQEGNLWCIVMEYIDGKNLADLVLNRGVLPETEALIYIQQIGEALSVIHHNNLLHRDIKPQNIMLRSGKREAVLIDFGIAREFSPNLTQTHTQILSDGYAPIEQYDRRAKRGAFTDVYALAATLYSILTGEVPMFAPLRAIGNELESPKKLNSNISDRVNQAILKGMELKPENRPQSIQEWLSILANQRNCNKSDRIIRLFGDLVDYQSPNAGLLIHHWDGIWHFHITISETHAFGFGENGFAIYTIPPNSQQVTKIKLLTKQEVLDRCLIAYQLFKEWQFGLLGWNCEHFARLVATGEAVSYQVKHSVLGVLNHGGYHPLAKKLMDEAYQSPK